MSLSLLFPAVIQGQAQPKHPMLTSHADVEGFTSIREARGETEPSPSTAQLGGAPGLPPAPPEGSQAFGSFGEVLARFR